MIIGIDHSITSPALAFEEAIIYVNNKKKNCLQFSKGGLFISGKRTTLTTKSPDMDRFQEATEMLLGDFVDKIEPGIAVFEDYAFAAKGQMTRIAESTFCTKKRLYDRGWKIKTLSPSAIKKYATGKGNSNKEQMAEAWKEKFGWYLHDFMGCKIDSSPSTDVVDAYFIRQTYIGLQDNEE